MQVRAKNKKPHDLDHYLGKYDPNHEYHKNGITMALHSSTKEDAIEMRFSLTNFIYYFLINFISVLKQNNC